MEARGGDFEIVYVMDGSTLVDSEHYERPYFCGRDLAPGYYVVTWPDDIRAGRFNEQARFQGPYRRRPEASAAAGSPLPVAEADVFALAESRSPASRKRFGHRAIR
jgi:hypothetical protein